MSDEAKIELTEYRIRMSNGEEQIVRGTFAEGTMDSNVFVYCGDEIVAEFYKPLGWFTPPRRKVLGFEAGFNDALHARSQGGQSDEYRRGQDFGSELYRWRAVQTDIDNGHLKLVETNLANEPPLVDTGVRTQAEGEAPTLGPADPFLNSILERGGTWHDGGPNPAPDWFVDIFVPTASTSLRDQPNYLEGQPSNAYIWNGWEVAYVRTQPMQAPAEPSAPVIDAEPEAPAIPEGFIPWSGEDVFTPTPDSDDKTYSVEVLYRDGTRNINKAWTFVWGWKDNAESSSNIIAYKVISEPAQPSEAEAPCDSCGAPYGDLHNIETCKHLADATAEAIFDGDHTKLEAMLGRTASEAASELDSQDVAQTKSEQSEIFHPDAPTWNAGFEEDRKPKPDRLEEFAASVGKLFKRELA